MAVPRLRRLFRLVGRPSTVEQDVDQEIAFHLDEETRRLEARGLSPARARAEAVRQFGDIGSARATMERLDREKRMQQRRTNWLTDLTQDIAYGFRGIRRQPGFAALVVATLGLGVGANVTMFGIVDRILLQPPALLKNPGLTGRVYLRRPNGEGGERIDNNISYRRYLDLQRGSRAFAAMAAFYDDESRVIGSGTDARAATVSLVTATFWGMFDVRPVAGRFFGLDDDQAPAGTPVAVLGHRLWRTRFGGDTAVIGTSVRIGPRPYTIVGIAPPRFSGMSMRDVAAFIPLTAGGFDDFGDRYAATHNLSWVEVVARRRAGEAGPAADADLTRAFRQSRAEEPGILAAEVPQSRAELAPVLYERGPKAGSDAQVALWLAAVAMVVLLIACANVANLLLSRSAQRRREIAVRLALGAGRRRLFRQLLTESGILALFGGVAGLVLAQVGGGPLRSALIPDVDWSLTPAFDPRLAGFAALAALVTAALTGIAPAWRAGRPEVVAELKSGDRGGDQPRKRLRVGLLVVQAALSVMLLVGAGLFVKSLRNIHRVDLGYDHRRILVATTDLRGTELKDYERGDLYRRLRERAGQLAGVERTTLSFGIPFWRSNTTDLFVPGRDSLGGLGLFYQNIVADGYFETTGTTIQRGRGLTALDRSGPAAVVVVSETLARNIWPNGDPIGQCIKVDAETAPCSEIVGIAKDVRWGSLGNDDRMQVYQPMRLDDTGVHFVRVAGDPEQLIEPVRRELQQLMPGNGFVTVRWLETTLAPVLRPWALGAAMFSLFGLLALVVSAVGLYGGIAYSVSQRRHEMGIRAALGAEKADLLRLVVGEGLRVTLLGVAIGAAAALAVGRFLAGLLYGVSPADPTTLAGVAVTTLLVAGLASAIPAWRASRADPNAALRSD